MANAINGYHAVLEPLNAANIEAQNLNTVILGASVTAIGIGYILAEPTGGATVSPEEVSA